MRSMILLSSFVLLSCSRIIIPSHYTKIYSYSDRFKACWEANFEISSERVGRVGEFTRVALVKCDNITGFHNVKGWPALRAWFENLFNLAADENEDFEGPELGMEFHNVGS